VNLFTIPPQVRFLDALAATWLARAGNDPLGAARGLILLPTRRAARALADAFLRVSDGRPLLLPRITAFGALDEAPLALAGALDLPPAVTPERRLAALSRLILAMNGAGGAPRTADRAWPLAAELAALMDEAELAEVDLAARLPDAADAEHAAHWQHTLTFLEIVTRAWPAWLAEQGVMNPAARQVALLRAQAAVWEAAPPGEPVLVAGTTGAVPAVARLLRGIARSELGAVVLPGLDLAMDDAAWDALEESHPQAGMRTLLARLGATRADVRLWPTPLPQGEREKKAPSPCGRGLGKGRSATLNAALLPADALDSWRHAPPARIDGLSRLFAADQQEEAASIALILRGALEQPGHVAALVTPDRDLAGRVAAELSRYGVVADDSAGEPLANTPPAVFLRLLAHAVAEELAPVPLLALLKHPLAAAGLSPAACRDGARTLELAALRGPRPAPGLTRLREATDRARQPYREKAASFLGRVETCLAPALRIASAAELVAPAEALRALIASAELLAGTDTAPGAPRLWPGEEGEALATHLAAILEVLPQLPDQRVERLPALLEAVLEGVAVRTRRALRGRAGSEHPRVFIWGLLEARLQAVDVVVLGGLCEGVWPPAADPGPWLSRRMRERIGLPSPEARVGQSAHDFASLACAADEVVLSCPRRRDGAPSVPSRWLTRIDAFLAGQNLAPPQHPAATWARRLDQPNSAPRPARPPRPCPDLRLRPRRLSVTEIETWLRDPYAIHAKHILRLRPLDPIDEPADAARYGMLAHDGLHRFLRAHGTAWPPDAAGKLREAMYHALADARLREALIRWWRPRFTRIADWVAALEDERRRDAPPAALLTEASGEWRFERPGGPFVLRGRADRIERRADGRLAILDYKTGTPPGQSQVDAGYAPQLPLEAAMAEAGAFGPDFAAAGGELAYWHLTGGFMPGELRVLFKGQVGSIDDGVAQARNKLMELIDAYDDPTRPYLAQPRPGEAPRFSDYAQLARVAEWATAEDAG